MTQRRFVVEWKPCSVCDQHAECVTLDEVKDATRKEKVAVCRRCHGNMGTAFAVEEMGTPAGKQAAVIRALINRASAEELVALAREASPELFVERKTDENTCLGAFGHQACPVVLYDRGQYLVCQCECRPCKRRWWNAGRPVVRDGKLSSEKSP